MALLRPHQLAQPELVTEGMNRLAQAVILVESAPSLSPPPPVAVSPAPPALKLRARVVTPPISTPPRPPPPEVALPLEPVPELVVASDVPAPPPGLGREGRRLFYRELAALRATLRALEQARPTLADVAEPLESPLAVTTLVEAANAFSQALSRPASPSGLAWNCPTLAAICRATQAPAIVRSLTTEQRGRVAREWSTTRDWALARQNSLRQALRGGPRFRIIATRARFGAGGPGWLVAATAGFAFLVALVRSIT